MITHDEILHLTTKYFRLEDYKNALNTLIAKKIKEMDKNK